MGVSSSSAGSKLLLLTLLTGAGLVAAGTAATVYAAGDVQRREAHRASSVSGARTDGRNWRTLAALADSLTAPLGARAPLDSGYLAQLVDLVAAPRDSASWIPHQHPAAGLDDSLALFRRLAYVEPLPAFWGARAGFAGLDDSRGVPSHRLQTLKALSTRNEADADSALVRGDTSEAMLRARENVAVARQLVLQPHPLDALVGRTLMKSAAALLARAALQAGQPSTHSAAQRLQSVTQSWKIASEGTFAGPRGPLNDDDLRAIARDRSVHPATRFLAIERMVVAACLSTRDVLFGPGAERHEAIDAMIHDTRDIPRVHELQPLLHRTLDHLAQDPATFMGPTWKRSTQQEPVHEALLRLFVPRTIQARIDVCRAAT
jgi:hypothetical protein